ncbi:FtsK/SpoIIIE domain-containing protein [Leifsonia sp. A12D58]|uniref:FtsK/SpoIIIE domain-containing protein n=1 Tax=Leifsonia sp. A12D58 TaxID=3397674 RepID=UPI0039DF337F
MIETSAVVRIPERPIPQQRAVFPVIATVAPMLLSVVMWVITGSAYMLLFAALGPVIALSTLFDSHRGIRKARAAAESQFNADTAAALAKIAVLHAEQRQAGWALTPSVALIADAAIESTMAGAAADATRATAPYAHDWASSAVPSSALQLSATLSRWQREATPVVALGMGTVPSDVRIESSGLTGLPDSPDQWSGENGLALAARGCPGAPVVASAASGIGLVGPLALTVPFARGLVLQLAHRMHPTTLVIDGCMIDQWGWMRELPHAAGRASPAAVFELVVSEETANEGRVVGRGHGGSGEILIAVAESSGALPPGCATIVRVEAPQIAQVLRSPEQRAGLHFKPELVSLSQARQITRRLSVAAGDLGLTRRATQLPHQVSLDDLWTGTQATIADQRLQPMRPLLSLRCPIGIDADGVTFVDLIEHGPHAIVGGTTGSGKSELLVTWVVAMAAEFPASALTFLLVDFKGGATFDALSRLPHCVGLITDLNVREAQRALESLRAEIRYREEALRSLGARDIADQTGSLPRLVIVVDEFQAMLDAFPALHAVFLDVAARGRSLGIHLILCTQRPAGVVRDALLANCSLRLSLRVNNRADSIAVLGTGDAADIEAAHAGRCLIAAGESVVLCQVAVTGQSRIERIAGFGGADDHAPRRPWLDPLPDRVERADLDGVGVVGAETRETELLLGLADDPGHQRYRVAMYDPVADGSLLVVGKHHSGRTSLIALLASQSGSALGCTVIPPDAEAVWDALAAAVLRIERAQFGRRRHGAPTVLLFDDFDAVCASWGVEHQESALEMLGDVLRRGPGVGLYCVVASAQLMPGLQRIRSLIPSTLLLGMGSAAEHVAFGGPGALYDDDMPPGGGFWRGLRTQLLTQARAAITALASRATAETETDGAAVIPIRLAEHPTLVVVSGRPGATGEFLHAHRAAGTTIIDVGAAEHQLKRRPVRELDPEALDVSSSAVMSEILVGDMEAWQALWPLFISLRRHALVVLEHCSLADYRFISRSRTLPPYLSPGRGHVWVIGPDGDTQRGVFV